MAGERTLSETMRLRLGSINVSAAANAALTGESAGRSRELTELAERLEQWVSQFRWGAP